MLNKLIKNFLKVLINVFLLNQKLFEYFQKEVENKILVNVIKKYSHLGIKNIYDIGANKGTWSSYLKKYFPNFNFILFEASKRNEIFLKESKFQYFITCLSSEEKEIEFFEIGGTGDSYYKEISNHYKDITPVKVKSRKLFNLINEFNLPYPDLIKIDTQGSEIDIMRGLEDIIFSSKLILVEISISETNINAPIIGDYLSYFESINFSAIEITEKHFSKEKYLKQIDVIFINNKKNG